MIFNALFSGGDSSSPSKIGQEAGVKQLVAVLSVRHNPAQSRQVSDIISRLAIANTIPPKLVTIFLYNLLIFLVL